MDHSQALWCITKWLWIEVKENGKTVITLKLSFLAECIMAVKIAQLEEFCTHSKILGGYLIRPDKHT